MLDTTAQLIAGHQRPASRSMRRPGTLLLDGAAPIAVAGGGGGKANKAASQTAARVHAEEATVYQIHLALSA